MTSEMFEALLIAERRCIEQEHQDERIINVVYTEQAYAPSVCDECIEYAYQVIEKSNYMMGIENVMYSEARIS